MPTSTPLLDQSQPGQQFAQLSRARLVFLVETGESRTPPEYISTDTGVELRSASANLTHAPAAQELEQSIVLV